MSIHSGPPVITEESVADHYTHRPSLFLMVVGLAGAALFIGGLACAVASVIRSHWR